MKKLRFVFILVCFSVVSSSLVFAKSPVWKISKDGNHLFIGGTIHLLAQSDYPLPESFAAAYGNSTSLVLEVDLQKVEEPDFQQIMLQKCRYKGKQNIRQFLNEDTFQALHNHLKNRRMTEEALLKFKPGFLSTILTVVELQRLGLSGVGVDKFYCLKALNDKRTIRYLETVDEQVQFISTLGEGNENAFIAYSLNSLKFLPQTFSAIKDAWRNGEIDRLQQVALLPWQKQFPKIYSSIFVQRNKRWIPKIETMLQTEEVELILFGALHLVGEDGILQQLKNSGYTVTNL